MLGYKETVFEAVLTSKFLKQVTPHEVGRVNMMNELISVKGKKPNIKDWGAINDTNFSEVLEFKKGARVIMTHNRDVSDGLVNGVTGKVLEYVWRNSQITAIIVEFDDKKLIGMIVYIHFIQEKNVLPTIHRFSII